MLRLCQRCLALERAAVLYVNEVVDGAGVFGYLDSVDSVSALPEPEQDSVKKDLQYSFDFGESVP